MYEIFIYLGHTNWLNGKYKNLVHLPYIPTVGQQVNEFYKVVEVNDSLGIIDVLCDPIS